MNDRPEAVFPKGISVFRRHPKAPPFIKFKLKMNVNSLIPWLREARALGLIDSNGDISFDGKESSKEGNPLYLQVDTYKSPETRSVEGIKEQIGSNLQYRTNELSEGERSALAAKRDAHNKANDDFNSFGDEINPSDIPFD